MSEVNFKTHATPGVVVPLASIASSKTNPRKHFDEGSLEELTQSVRNQGILQPLVVRPVAPSGAEALGFEVVAGERRLRAARKAGLTEVPVVIRNLTDAEAREVQVIENLQREDLHPLEEAEGYRQLLARGNDTARVAERIGRSVRYVYDRLKLLSLTKAAQKVFLDGKISAGHAVLLARLAPKDQARAMEDPRALFTDERCLFTPEEEDERDGDHEDCLKPRSVREFQGWIDAHVKLEHAEADPMLAALAEGVCQPEQLVKDAKACFDLYVLKILNEVAPPATKEASCRKCGCTMTKPCVVAGQGCAWIEKPDPKTGKGLCSACAPKAGGKRPAKKRGKKPVDRVAQHLE